MISVCIATIDRPELVTRCVASVLEGTSRPAEVVVVDQSSGPQTRLALEALGAGPLVRHLPSPPLGASGARNRAVEAAGSDYVALLDDDAEVPPEWLGAVERELERFGHPDALYGAIRATGGEDDRRGLSVSTFTPSEAALWSSVTHPARLGYAGHMVARRSTFLGLGGFDTRLGPGTPLYGAEDMDFNYRLLKDGRRAATAPAVWMLHHQHRAPSALPRLMYGYNLGYSAFCAKHLRRGDRYPLLLVAIQAAGDAKMLASAVRRRSWLRARVAAGRTAGTWEGLWRGWRSFRP
jgi:glycosyltransferase involved in cell wall biosynthesis